MVRTPASCARKPFENLGKASWSNLRLRWAYLICLATSRYFMPGADSTENLKPGASMESTWLCTLAAFQSCLLERTSETRSPERSETTSPAPSWTSVRPSTLTSILPKPPWPRETLSTVFSSALSASCPNHCGSSPGLRKARAMTSEAASCTVRLFMPGAAKGTEDALSIVACSILALAMTRACSSFCASPATRVLWSPQLVVFAHVLKAVKVRPSSSILTSSLGVSCAFQERSGLSTPGVSENLTNLSPTFIMGSLPTVTGATVGVDVG
mmetsp:Transcript_40541/g.97150  ORF Transcript_40541/g.97150 Transcript_40541/m.97150 type:complete len:270 (-) Transcript_40541:40-849(-)